MLLQRGIAFAGLGLFLAACVTNTRFDALIYPSEYYYTEIADDEKTADLCFALEEKGYTFDEFDVAEYGTQVSYPDGEVKQFVESRSLNIVMLVSINRDFDNPNLFSDEEFDRLSQEAQNFCNISQQVATDLAYNLPISGVLFWDWINGVRGGFNFSETCEITELYSWSSGSYASSYNLRNKTTCPSGHVVH